MKRLIRDMLISFLLLSVDREAALPRQRWVKGIPHLDDPMKRQVMPVKTSTFVCVVTLFGVIFTAWTFESTLGCQPKFTRPVCSLSPYYTIQFVIMQMSTLEQVLRKVCSVFETVSTPHINGLKKACPYWT